MSSAVGAACEEPQADRQTLLVAGADGDDAGDELLERRVEAALGQLEHRRLGVRLHRLRDALQGDVDVEGLLPSGVSTVISSARGAASLRGWRSSPQGVPRAWLQGVKARTDAVNRSFSFTP